MQHNSTAHVNVTLSVLLQDQWYPDLLSTVKKINQTFQRNFKDIGCAGEVSLAEHTDYDKFAVQIRQVMLESCKFCVSGLHEFRKQGTLAQPP